MMDSLPQGQREGPRVEFEIITRADRVYFKFDCQRAFSNQTKNLIQNSIRMVDVAHVQAMQENRNAVFQAGKFFNSLILAHYL